MFQTHMTRAVEMCLTSMNTAFKMVRCEAPILTPKELINPAYDPADYFTTDGMVLRPETTMGSYEYAKHVLSGYHDPKYRPPICVWQHGKRFRREQDQPTKFVRLKEFYQLEFQILFDPKTANDYYPRVVMAVRNSLEQLLGYGDQSCRVVISDRLPVYSEETNDIVLGMSEIDPDAMEICSISRRKDYPGLKNVEVAIGTDRAVVKYQEKCKALEI